MTNVIDFPDARRRRMIMRLRGALPEALTAAFMGWMVAALWHGPILDGVLLALALAGVGACKVRRARRR